MLNKKKILSIASAGIALMAITGSVYAATSTDPASTTADSGTQKAAGKHQHKGPFQNKELATLLNMDFNTLQQAFKDGKSLTEIASAQGVDVQKVIDLLVNQETQRLDQAVTSGKLTQSKADEVKKNIPDRVENIVERKGGFEHGGRGGKDHDGKGGTLADAASVLGVDQQELFTQLKSGKTLTGIAEDKGISQQDLIDKLVQKDKERITKLVEKTWQQKDHDASQKTTTTTQSTTSTPAAQ